MKNSPGRGQSSRSCLMGCGGCLLLVLAFNTVTAFLGALAFPKKKEVAKVVPRVTFAQKRLACDEHIRRCEMHYQNMRDAVYKYRAGIIPAKQIKDLNSTLWEMAEPESGDGVVRAVYAEGDRNRLIYRFYKNKIDADPESLKSFVEEGHDKYYSYPNWFYLAVRYYNSIGYQANYLGERGWLDTWIERDGRVVDRFREVEAVHDAARYCVQRMRNAGFNPPKRPAPVEDRDQW